MAKKQKRKAAATPQTPSSYELMGERIRRQINSPKAQEAKCAELSKLPEEREEDWDRFLEEIGTLDHVTIIPLEDGAVRLRWNPEESMS